jgi:hypothetical protein
VARPRASTVTSRAMARVMTFRLPVATAGGSSTVVDWKFAPMLQPRPQGVAQMQASRFCMLSIRIACARGLSGWTRLAAFSASICLDSTAMREGITGMPMRFECFCNSSS